LLLLFAISVTPKQLFHDVITGHNHTYSKSDGTVKFQASKTNFQCNWHNDVVESPFTGQPDFQVNHLVLAHSSHTNCYILSHYSAELFFSSLRGPPSLA
jgi:hypothetical protein